MGGCLKWWRWFINIINTRVRTIFLATITTIIAIAVPSYLVRKQEECIPAMPHADSSFVPTDISSKKEFYAHVEESLKHLLEGERYWVTNLAQTSSLLYHSYLACHLYGGTAQHPVVNWAGEYFGWEVSADSGQYQIGFYLHPPGHSTSSSTSTSTSTSASTSTSRAKPLLLGPYHGRPACLSITPIAGRGVCADAFVSGQTVVVSDVESYPGHIACDGDTKAEIVVPLLSLSSLSPTQTQLAQGDGEREEEGGVRGEPEVIGVLDLDSTQEGTFDDEDRAGLESIVRLLAEMTDF